MNKKFLTRLLPVIIIYLIVLVIIRFCQYSDRKELSVNDHKWDKLLLILEQIDKNYVDTINYDRVIEKTLPALMENLDPHSLYLPPEKLKSADEFLDGNFSGIGIEFNVPDDTVTVITVVRGGPSEKAGILSGDKIITVDGKNIAGVRMNQDSIVACLKGREGSVVNLEVKRDNLEELLKFSIVRDRIPVNSLDVAMMLNDTVGYMKLSKFARSSHAEFSRAAEKLRKEGLKRLVFDLRDNVGGYLDQALLLANEFLEKGDLIVYMEGLHRKRRDFHADGKGKMQDIKLYVVINENSASSSEIFAGAIQDNDRGIIVGRRSFGKGLVQEPIYFTDKSGIRLTVARYYTPTGRSIQKPYSENYRYDILERYEHGEMLEADSIRVNDSLKFVTPMGKVLYGGGGITPDIFVPIDTVGVTDYLIAVNRKSLQIKYSAKLADRYRAVLREVKSMEQLQKLISGIEIGEGFKRFALSNGVALPSAREWKKCENIIVTQVKGLFGRYSALEDEAFYSYMLKIDNVMDAIKKDYEKQTCKK